MYFLHLFVQQSHEKSINEVSRQRIPAQVIKINIQHGNKIIPWHTMYSLGIFFNIKISEIHQTKKKPTKFRSFLKEVDIPKSIKNNVEEQTLVIRVCVFVPCFPHCRSSINITYTFLILSRGMQNISSIAKIYIA